MPENAVTVSGLGKRYRLGELSRPTRITEAAFETASRLVRRSATGRERGRREIWALRDLDLEIPAGQALGVVGRNGSGKSTLLKVLARITEPTVGRVELRGRVGAVIEIGTGFHPELTGRENIFLNGAILGMSRGEIKRKFDAIAEFSEVEDFLDTPIKRYSSGMKIRLAFAVAAHLEPEILLIDEVLAVGDAEFQRRCLGRMDEIRRGGRTIVFVSHNSSAVESLCERAIWLDAGQIVHDGPSSATVRTYLRDRARLAEAVWRPSEAAGDRDLELHEVRLAAQDGAPAVEFRRDEPVVLEFEVLVRRRRADYRIGFDLANQEGLTAFAAVHVDDPELGDAVLEPGRYVLRARIPARLLNHGLYSVHARVGVHNIRWVVHQDDVLQFEIRPDDNLVPQRPGLVLPEVDWSRERAAAPSTVASST